MTARQKLLPLASSNKSNEENYHYCICFNILLFSCSNKNGKANHCNGYGQNIYKGYAGRGSWIRQETLLLNDTLNVSLFDRYRDYYKDLKPEDKAAYKKANYTINTYTDVK
jgi:hypothetical protein